MESHHFFTKCNLLVRFNITTVMCYRACDTACDHTDLIKLPVGAENEGQDMKHFDPDHGSRLVPVSKTVT